MLLHPTGTDPTPDALLVCRNARFNLLILLAVFWCIPALWWWIEAPGFVTYGTVALALLLTPFLLSSWRTMGRPENWMLALSVEGLWINLRDCEYYAAEPGMSVVYIPYRDIESATETVNRYTTPRSGSGSGRRHNEIMVDLKLTNPSQINLRQAILDERRIKTHSQEYFGGFISVGTGRVKRQPVDLIGNDLLRIKFTAGNYGLIPRPKKVFEILNRYVKVEGQTEQNLDDWHKLNDDEFDRLVHKMVRDGGDIKAVNLLTRRRKMSTTEAYNFVQEIRRQL